MTKPGSMEESSSCSSSTNTSSLSSAASFDLTSPRWSCDRPDPGKESGGDDVWSIERPNTEYYAPLFNGLDSLQVPSIYDDLVKRKKFLEDKIDETNLQPRDYAIKELLTTEENYVETLNELIQEYQHVISMGQEEKYDILLNITDLYNFHQHFLMLLLDASKNLPGRTERLAKVFVDWQDKFLLYGEYCVRLQHAQAKICLLRQTDPGFHRVLSMCRRNSTSLGRFRLEDLLVVPFQRVLKYHLLLSNIQRYETEDTPRSQQKKSALQQAIDAMNDVNNYINEIKRDSENLKTLEDVQNKIPDFTSHCSESLRDYGRLMMDGQIKVKLHNQNLKRRKVFLLEKAVLICRPKGDKLIFKALIGLAQMRLEDNGQVDIGREQLHEFALRDRDFLNISHSFLCQSEIEKSKWIGIMAKCLINLSSKYLSGNGHNHSFSYTTMPQSGQRCQVCRRYLTGLILQGFQCCLCSYEVHRECIALVPPCPSDGNVDIVRSPNGEYADYALIGRRNNLPDLVKSTHQNYNNVEMVCTRKMEGRSYCMQLRRRSSAGAAKKQDASNYISMNENDGQIPNPLLKHRICTNKCCRTQSCRPKPTHCLAIETNNTALNESSDENRIQRYYPRISDILSDCENENFPSSENLTGEIWFANWTRKKTEHVLGRDDVPDNTFLVRPRESPGLCCCSEYSLSLKHRQRIFHIRIHKIGRDPSEYYLMDSRRFQSVQKLIKYYMMNSLEENFPPVQSSLVYPIHTVLRINV